MDIIKDITDFIFLETPLEKADIIFIPGGNYHETVVHAAALMLQGLAPYILPSGRFGMKHTAFPGPVRDLEQYRGAYESEWAFMQAILLHHGVKPEQILKEDQARYTYQNAQFSRLVTEGMNLKVENAILCCKAFHARRCLMYYQICYPQTRFMISPVETQGISRDSWTKTPKGIDKVLGEVERCGGQFKDIFKEILL